MDAIDSGNIWCRHFSQTRKLLGIMQALKEAEDKLSEQELINEKCNGLEVS
jgi:hypothetical protein